MARCIVIGANGFIGAAVAAEAARRGYEVVPVDRAHYEVSKGQAADLLVHAAGNSRKYLDERDPAAGFERTVAAIVPALLDFRPRRFIHLSSGAVYPHEGDTARNREDAPLAPELMTRYGFHKWLAEQLVRHYAADWAILRLGGCVGPGLRKNALYDLLTGGPLFVHPDSEFQYMDVRDIAAAIFRLHESGLAVGTVLNLSALGTVSVRQAAEWAGRTLPADVGQLSRCRAELNVERAAALLPLPETADVVRNFICETESGRIRLGAGLSGPGFADLRFGASTPAGT